MITLQQLARASGYSLATVSYALRSDPRIRQKTRSHVQAVATRLGYRPNPRFSALMSHIRNSRPVATGERIAFVWVHTPRAESTKDPFLQRVFHGANIRADALGYRLEQFWTADRGMTDRRLSQVLKSRGIIGVLLSPVMHEAEVTLDVEWSCFAPAVIGSARWNPELHHAGHHHFLAMRLALRELEKCGCRRPAGIIDADTNERAKRAWEAAFLAHHPSPASARKLVRVRTVENLADAAAWFIRSKADALIVSDTALLETPGLRAACRALGAQIATLHWRADTPARIGGIDQSYDQIAAQAVDLVAAQLNANETGVPPWPHMLLFPGRWVESKKLKNVKGAT
jgi:LacI family transcriptional regulator